MKALVLSGGGSKGAWQAGVLQGLLVEGKLKDYDLICGVSVGALNGGFLAQYDDISEGVSELSKRWKNLKTKNIYKKWLFWPFSALWKSSIYNSDPLREWVEKEIQYKDFKKKFIAGTVSHDTGQYVSWDNQSPYIIEAILASSSFPGFLKPIPIIDQLYVDGGVRNVTPLKEAVDAGATEVDVIMTSPKKMNIVRDKDVKTIDLLQRTIDILMSEIIETDLKLAIAYNKVEGRRHVDITIYRPDEILSEGVLDFDNTQKMFLKGFRQITT